MKPKNIRSVVTKCHECDATSQDAILEFVKDRQVYLCENCLMYGGFDDDPDGSDTDSFGSNKRKSLSDDDFDDEG